MAAVLTIPSVSDVLDHDLQKYFPELLKFESTREMEASELYKKIRADVERILNSVVSIPGTIVTGALFTDAKAPVAAAPSTDRVTALAWNIERGSRFGGIVDALKNHP